MVVDGLWNVDDEIKSFKITDRSGFVFEFSTLVTTLKRSYEEGKIYQREQDLYKHQVEYISTWYLTRITSPAGEMLTYNYTSEGEKMINNYAYRSFFTKTDEVEYGRAYTGIAGSYIHERYTNLHLSEIKVYEAGSARYKQRIFFDSEPLPPLGPTLGPSQKQYNIAIGAPNSFARLNNLKIFNYVDTDDNPYELLVGNYKFHYFNSTANSMYFLKSIESINGIRGLATSVFEYESIGLDNDNIYVHSSETDVWGYFTNDNEQELAEINGNQLESDPPKVFMNIGLAPLHRYNFNQDDYYDVGWFKALDGYLQNNNQLTTKQYGCLVGVEHAGGFYTRISYEQNTYYDEGNEETENGPGLRVKSIVHYNQKADFSLESLPYLVSAEKYEYLLPDGNTSGRITNLPQHTFQTNYYQDPYTGSKKGFRRDGRFFSEPSVELVEAWDSLTLRTNFDLNAHNPSQVLYSNVRKKLVGNGWIDYEFDIPVYFGVSSAGDYIATTTSYVGSPQQLICEELGIISDKTPYVFPYAINPDYSFENGLLKQTTLYNEEGERLEETIYTYQRLNEANKKIITGLSITKNPGYYAEYYYGLSPYRQVTNVNTVPREIESRKYDEAGTGKFISSKQRYTYSLNTNLLVKSELIQGNKTKITEHTYAADFPEASEASADARVKALALLNKRNSKATPVETVNKLQNTVTGTTTITSAAFTEYTDNKGYILPAAHYTTNGFADGLQNSYINANGNLIKDTNHYTKVSGMHDFSKGVMLTAENNFGNLSGTHITDNGLPVVSISNAGASQVIYSSFDAKSSYEFNTGQSGTYGEGYIGKKGFSLSANMPMSYSEYVRSANTSFNLTFWAKTNTSSTITIKATDEAGKVKSLSQGLAANSDWQRVNFNLVLEGSWGTTLAIELKSSGSLTIDEVLFKPKDAYVSLTNYNIFGQPIAITANDGQTVYQEYDVYGRVIVQKDNAGDIIKAYQFSEEPEPLLTSDFEVRGNVKANTIMNFVALEPESSEVQYFWTFGNETEAKGERAMSHIFEEIGYYTVVLRVEHARKGSSTLSRKIRVY